MIICAHAEPYLWEKGRARTATWTVSSMTLNRLMSCAHSCSGQNVSACTTTSMHKVGSLSLVPKRSRNKTNLAGARRTCTCWLVNTCSQKINLDYRHQAEEFLIEEWSLTRWSDMASVCGFTVCVQVGLISEQLWSCHCCVCYCTEFGVPWWCSTHISSVYARNFYFFALCVIQLNLCRRSLSL